MKWGSRGVAKVEEMACHLSSAFKGRTLLMKILTVESIMDPLCLTFDSELSPRDNVRFQKHCPEGNNGFHVLSVFKLSTFPSFYPTIAFLWFLNTPSYTELWPDTHCLTLSLDHRGLKIVAWPCPPPSTSPRPHTLSFVLDYTCLVGCCSAMLEWGPVGLGFLTLAGCAGWSSGERSSGWNTWQKQRRPSSLIEWLGSWVASWLIRVLASQVVGLDPMAVL